MSKSKVSVVIPCRNEGKYIEECIHAIMNNEGLSEMELSVFVVDGMSDDDTREKVIQLKETYSALYLLDNEQQLTPFAFNIGIKKQKADYIQIIGARHIVSKDYLNKSLNILKADSSIWCVGGQLINEYTTRTSAIISQAMDTSFGMGLGNFRILSKSGFTDTVTSPMYPYWVFEKIGFFDENLIRNQDDDFNYRVTSQGGKIWFEHSIFLKYYVRASYQGLYRQFFQYGYWKVWVNKKHKAVTTLRQLVPPLFTFYLLLLPLFLILGGVINYLYLLGIGLYLSLGLFVSIKKAQPKRDFFGIYRTFPILHISYGLGYLLGIVHFLLLNKKASNKQKRLSR